MVEVDTWWINFEFSCNCVSRFFFATNWWIVPHLLWVGPLGRETLGGSHLPARDWCQQEIGTPWAFWDESGLCNKMTRTRQEFGFQTSKNGVWKSSGIDSQALEELGTPAGDERALRKLAAKKKFLKPILTTSLWWNPPKFGRTRNGGHWNLPHLGSSTVILPAGRARWSGGGAHAHASRASYSSYTSDFQGYGYGSYSYETRLGFQMGSSHGLIMGHILVSDPDGFWGEQRPCWMGKAHNWFSWLTSILRGGHQSSLFWAPNIAFCLSNCPLHPLNLMPKVRTRSVCHACRKWCIYIHTFTIIYMYISYPREALRCI